MPRSRRWPTARRSASTSTCRCSTRPNAVLKRMKRPGHAADATTRCWPASAIACPASRSGPPSSSAFRARPTQDVDELCWIRRGPSVRPRRRLHVFPRGRHVRLRARRRRAGQGQEGAAIARDGSAEAAGDAGGKRARVGERARIVVDGPSSDHELVLKGRLPSQAPDIDAAVFLTECDPSSFRPGRFRRRRDRRGPRLRSARSPCLRPASRRAIILDSEPR